MKATEQKQTRFTVRQRCQIERNATKIETRGRASRKASGPTAKSDGNKKNKLRIPGGGGGGCLSAVVTAGKTNLATLLLLQTIYRQKRNHTFSYITVALLFSPNVSVDISQNNDDFFFFFANL